MSCGILLITESVAVTKLEIVSLSLFLYSLIQEYVTQVIREDNTRRESGETKAVDLALTREDLTSPDWVDCPDCHLLCCPLCRIFFKK